MNKTLILLLVVMGINECALAVDLSKVPISTLWAEKLDANAVHQEYPRPQLVRKDWLNLNGYWDYAYTKAEDGRPSGFQGRALVPFSVEAPLSGVEKRVTADDAVWYARRVSLPSAWRNQQVLLNFEASDWETTVWVNGKEVGTHQGGYDPFSFNISAALSQDAEQEIVVRAWDHRGTRFASLGKQVHSLYTKCAGIWQNHIAIRFQATTRHPDGYVAEKAATLFDFALTEVTWK